MPQLHSLTSQCMNTRCGVECAQCEGGAIWLCEMLVDACFACELCKSGWPLLATLQGRIVVTAGTSVAHLAFLKLQCTYMCLA